VAAHPGSAPDVTARAEAPPRATVVSRIDFAVSFSDDRRATVAISGEVDAANGEDLERVLDAIVGVGVVDVQVDAADVTFADGALLRALARPAGRLLDAGGSLVVVRPGRPVRRLLELSGHDWLLTRRGRSTRRHLVW
jgi:anti-anti-sigma factor